MTQGLWVKSIAAALLAVFCAGRSFAADGDASLVDRGRDLATAADCEACHTVPGQQPYAGGRAIATPFGEILASNITPDAATGIGAWTPDQFVAAVRAGIAPHNTHLYPAMPYTYFAHASRDDILAIFAYLKSLPPAANQVNGNRLPFPLNQRFLMIGWNLLFFRDTPFKADGGKPEAWNRGAYLVQGLGHCGACHTPKNVLGGDRRGRAFEGATLQSWHASNLTGDVRIGLGSWSAADIAAYLKAGHNRTADAIGAMAEVVTDSTALMSDADLAAIATYLKDIPARSQTVAKINHDTGPMQAGEAIFADNCTACHGRDGAGVSELFTPLDTSAVVQDADPTTIIRVVLEGVQSAGTVAAPTSTAMPALGWKLSDDQVAAVLTYIRNSWHNAATVVTGREVGRLRRKLAKDAARTP